MSDSFFCVQGQAQDLEQMMVKDGVNGQYFWDVALLFFTPAKQKIVHKNKQKFFYSVSCSRPQEGMLMGKKWNIASPPASWSSYL